MHPTHIARLTPDRAACIMAGSGEILTYRQLNQSSNQIAHLFRQQGLQAGDVVAILMENSPRYFELVWAAQRTGLYYACVSSKLSTGEVEYILADCGARMLVVSPAIGALAYALPAVLPGISLFITGPAKGSCASLDDAIAALPMTPITD